MGLMLSGCLVEDTMPGSPSFSSGRINKGDVITEVHTHTHTHTRDAQNVLGEPQFAEILSHGTVSPRHHRRGCDLSAFLNTIHRDSDPTVTCTLPRWTLSP